jgi:glycosyltransferase involved in cell wall biosynthesis
MKVAIYVQDMRASGVVRTMIALARFLAQEGDAATLLAGYAAGHFRPDDVAPAGFAAARDRPSRRAPRVTVIPDLRRSLRALAPDVVLSGGNFGHFSLWAASRGLNISIVYCFSNAMVREGQPLRNRWRAFWSGLLVEGSARAIVVGRTLADSAVFRGSIASGKAVLVHNGVELSRARAAPAEPAPPAMIGDDPVVLSIGRLQPQKNFEGLIDAVAAANRVRPLRLVILGGGADAYREALLARARARGIADRCLLPGVTDDVFAWLRAADVFALASHWEGSSIALLEAMAAGTPVVASFTAGDAPEVLDGGRHGLLADATDPDAFAAALLRQAGADPVRPGNRADAYDAEAMLRIYRALLHGAAEEGAGLRPTRVRGAPA